MGVGDGLSLVGEQGMMQRRTPDAVRSRVSAAFDAVLHSGLAVSYVVAGPAVAWLGAQGVYLVGGLGSIAALAIAVRVLQARTSPDDAPALETVAPTTPSELLIS
jgi:hypothetical protein